MASKKAQPKGWALGARQFNEKPSHPPPVFSKTGKIAEVISNSYITYFQLHVYKNGKNSAKKQSKQLQVDELKLELTVQDIGIIHRKNESFSVTRKTPKTL